MDLTFPLNNIALQAAAVNIIIYSISLIMVPRQSTINAESAMLAVRGNGVVSTCLSLAAIYMHPSLYLTDMDLIVTKKNFHEAYLTFSMFTGILIGTFLIAYQSRDNNSVTPCNFIGQRYHPILSMMMSIPFLFSETISLLITLWFLWSQYRTVLIMVIPIMSFVFSLSGGIDRISACDSMRFLIFFIGLIVFIVKMDTSHLKTVKINALITNYRFSEVASIIDRYMTIAMFTAARPSYYARVLSVTRSLGAPLASIIAYLFALVSTGILVVLTITIVYKDWYHTYPVFAERPENMHVYVSILRLLGDRQYYITALGHVILIITAAVSCDASFFSIKSIMSVDFLQYFLPNTSITRLILTSGFITLLFLILSVALIASNYISLTYQTAIWLYIVSIEYTYIVLVPQTICVFNIEWANGYGSVFGFWIGSALFGLIKVEEIWNLQIFKNYIGQYFPLNTFCAIIVLLFIMGISFIAKLAHKCCNTIACGDVELNIPACGIKIHDEDQDEDNPKLSIMLSSVYQEDPSNHDDVNEPTEPTEPPTVK